MTYPVSQDVPFAGDLDKFFKRFGVPVTLHTTPTLMQAVGIFDMYPSTLAVWDRDSFSQRYYEASVNSTRPALVIKSDYIANVDVGIKVTVLGDDFYIVGIETDGTGLTTLWLSRDNA